MRSSSERNHTPPGIFHAEDSDIEPPENISGMQFVARVCKSDIPLGVSGLRNNDIILFRDDNVVKAAMNNCSHRNGKFNLSDIEDISIVTCPNHGWKMDASRFVYTNPSGDRSHPQLVVIDGFQNDEVLLYAKQNTPWGTLSEEKLPLNENEFTRYLQLFRSLGLLVVSLLP